MVFQVCRKRTRHVEGDLEDIRDRVFVFLPAQAPQYGSSGQIIFEQHILQPLCDRVAFGFRRLFLVLGWHVTRLDHFPGLGPAHGRIGIAPIDCDEVEIHIALLRIGVVTIEAVFDEKAVHLFG